MLKLPIHFSGFVLSNNLNLRHSVLLNYALGLSGGDFSKKR